MKKIMDDEGHRFQQEEDAEMVESEETNLKKIRFNLGSGSGGAAQPSCVVDRCEADLRGCKKYYQRHKVCEVHSKAPEVTISGIRQRFCQQCSRFHEVSEFDLTKRSCRARLVGHNKRRRKSSSSLVKSAQTAEDSRSTSPASLMAFSDKKSYKIDWMSS